jgi:hypothetical protein
MKKYPRTVQLSLWTAIVTFLTALLILFWFFTDRDYAIAELGLWCLFIFGGFNIFVLLVLWISMALREVTLKQGLITTAVLLMNIPVAYFCMWAGHYLIFYW